MGLLSNIIGTGVDDPRFAATTQLAQGLLSSPRLMQGLSAGLGGYQQAMAKARQQKMQEELRQMQLADARMKMEAAQREQQKEQGIEAAYRNAMRTPEQMAMAQNGGPTVAAAQAAPGMQGGFDQNALMRGLSQADPMKAFQMMQPEKPNFVNVDGALVQTNAQGGPRSVFERNKPAEMPTAVREYQFAQSQGYDGTFQQFQLDGKRAGATKVQVDAGQRFENEFSRNQGKFFSEMKGDITKAGFNAPSQLRNLERMEQLLAGVDGGRLSPVGLEVASALNSMGIKVDPRLGNKEASEALARELAGGLRQPGTGPMTDKDFENFLRQVPSLSKTAEGRRQIIETQRRALNRDIQISKMAREYQRRNGIVDDGFMDEVAQYIAENPVIAAPVGWKVQRQ